MRVGLGHDLHRLVPGGRLVLGGVQIPADVGFDTHSDGDVLSHAIIDALAGALADGDLGTHFPEDDPAAEDARSLDFVTEFAVVVARHGYRIVNVDSFVVLGPIRLRPHLDEMRTNLARCPRRRRSGRLGQGAVQRRGRPGGRGHAASALPWSCCSTARVGGRARSRRA